MADRRFGWAGGIALVLTLGGAVPAQEATDWGGFYAGIFASYGLDTQAATFQTRPTTFVPLGAGSLVSSTSEARTRISGVLGGVETGYNFQFGQYVLGADGTLTLGTVSKNNTVREFASQTAGALFSEGDFTSTTRINVDWYTALTGSLGIAIAPDFLVFAKGGLAIGNVSTTVNSSLTYLTNDPASPLFSGVYPSSSSSSTLVAGPVLGFGVEKMITDNVSIGAEYAYIGLPDVRLSQPNSVGTAANALLGGGPGPAATYAIGLHTVKASLKYHF